MAGTTTVTIGCDLGDRASTLCILDADGALERPKPIKTTRAAFEAFFTLPPAHVILEVGTHSRWVSQLLEQLGHRVTVANPRRLKLISMSDSKNDRTDAELLARLGRADAHLLAPVKHRGTQAQADLAVAKARDALVACRTRLINFARGLVKSFEERLPACETEAFHNQAKDRIPASLKPALVPLLGTLEQVHEQIRACDKQLQQLAKKYPDVEVVSQPKGAGLLTALVFVLSLEDKGRFTSSRQVGDYLGLSPRQDQSGDTNKRLRITKAGDAYLRRLLINCATYILGPFGAESALRSWGLQLASRGGKSAKRRATVAVARNLAVLMHRLWVTGEKYEPVGYKPKRAAAWLAGRRSLSKGSREIAALSRPRAPDSRNHEPPHPGDCASGLELPSSWPRWQRPAGSDPNMHRATAAAHPSADGSVAERLLDRTQIVMQG